MSLYAQCSPAYDKVRVVWSQTIYLHSLDYTIFGESAYLKKKEKGGRGDHCAPLGVACDCPGGCGKVLPGWWFFFHSFKPRWLSESIYLKVWS